MTEEKQNYKLIILPMARFDMVEIWHYTDQNYSEKQADNYINDINKAILTIAHNPFLMPLRDKSVAKVRIFPVNRHIVVCDMSKENIIRIIRVLHDRQNWQEVLE